MNPEQFQQKLNDQDKKIKSLQGELELKNQCLSLITHDFAGVSRNLLWVIEALKDGSIDLDIFQTLYQELKSAAETNQKLIASTIAWINSQEAEFKPTIEDISVRELVTYLKNVLHLDLERKQMQLHLAGSEDISLTGDRILLQFILKALIENAVKYSPTGGTVTLRVERMDDATRLTVEDEGLGMSAGVMADLFSFRSSPYTGTDGEKGAGVSLIVAKKFADLQNFDIGISSVEGSGTKVELHIPSHELSPNRQNEL